MKVALLVPGGVDRSMEYRVIPCLLWLIERLAAAVDLHVFAFRQEARPVRYPLLGAEVHNIGARPTRLRLAGTIWREHARSPFDVLHAVWVARQGVVAAGMAKLLRRPLLLHVTGGDLAALPDIGFGLLAGTRGRWWLRLAARGASLVTVPSDWMRRLALEHGVVAERLPLGVARDRWPASPPRPRQPSAPARLLHVASLNRVKDQRTLLRAVEGLRGEGLPFRLEIVGQDTLRGEVHRFAAERGLGDLVTFHGFVPHSQLRPFVERADLLLISSRHEADPIVTLEAAVAGVPTVGTAVGHIADWSPEAAAAVPVGDADALAREIGALLRNEPRRLRMAAAAQARAVHEDADWSAQRILGIYQTLTGRAGGAG
ncbi:MAG TPA: glycosyltransferase family 4 protein [bacterium]